MKTIEVVAAVFYENDKVFCAKRKDEGELALKWEFPGGKVEKGETPQVALKREIEEEFNTLINVKEYITTVDHTYDTFRIILHAYYTERIKGDLILTEHTDFKWLSKKELKILDWAKADLPIVDKIIKT